MKSSCLRIGLVALTATIYPYIAGCEQNPPKPSSENKSAPSTQANLDAIKAAASAPVRPTRPSGASTGGSALPTGHPPIAGGQAVPVAPNDPPLPAGHPPLNPTAAGNTGIGAPPPPAAGDPKWDVPKDFVETPPANPMRRAQYTLPRAEGDAEDGEIIVNYFGPGQGGALAANLDRWRGQFTNPDGTPLAPDAAKTETFEAGKLKVTLLDVSGRMGPSTMTGAASGAPKDNFRMLAAMVETAKGPWFFKCTGPQKTMEKHAESIRTMLKSVRE